jgi:hypothetical protein
MNKAETSPDLRAKGKLQGLLLELFKDQTLEF